MNLESFANFENHQFESSHIIIGGTISETGDPKMNAELGTQDVYDSDNGRTIFLR
jgi:hypothetical protein